jgi:site-specific recombinase XerD
MVSRERYPRAASLCRCITAPSNISSTTCNSRASPSTTTLPLFRSHTHRGTVLSDRALRRENVYHMIQRRITDAGMGCHSFRGTGITNFLEDGGTLETAARIAGQASTKTTQLYDWRNSAIDQGEIEQIRF